MSVTLLTIDGNIGSGKSEFMQRLKEHYKNNENIIFAPEPVDEWVKIRDNEMTILEHFYTKPHEYSFSFQMMAFVSRLSILRKIVRENKGKDIIIITERNLFTDKYVFAKMLYVEGKINHINFQIYNQWFEEFSSDFPITYCVYLKSSPFICKERISKRNRKGEEEIRLSYLMLCDSYHDEYMKSEEVLKAKQLVLDGDKDIFQNPDIVKNWLTQIDEMIQK
jgi:deoxyadenosine/deoxycytidine kinase